MSNRAPSREGGPAIGDFTHLIVDPGAYPGSTLAGTRITKAMNRFGVSLVDADGTTTGPASTSCGNAELVASSRSSIATGCSGSGRAPRG